MDYETFKRLFETCFEQNGLEMYINEANICKFFDLTNIMVAKNQVMNITAIREVEKIIPLHYADCAKIAHLIPQNATVADIGCGGGFPTLPLAILRPDLRITGIDSTEKKVRYIGETANQLGLNVQTIACRAEELANNPQYRENFDCVTGRAVARLSILQELCLPFTKIGGIFIAMKGATGQEELDEAQNGIKILGGSVENTHPVSLLVGDEIESRLNIVVRKIQATPPKYPRQFGQIKKKPL